MTAFLSAGLSEHAAIGLAAIPYVLLHGRAPFASVEAAVRYAALGYGFGLVYVWTGSLWAAMVAHATHNLLVTIRHTRGYADDSDPRRGTPR